ncbi:hypothetical protein F5I97DRAFT_2043259 [Phlebopus sp. FC_14]|nr:hypothetical protein F5I97DRAFT_2043259 [Phlebopus sp. FC_14]
MFHFSADRLAGLDSMVLKISAPPKVPPVISNQSFKHDPYTNVKQLKRRKTRRATRAPLADKTTSSNAAPHVLPLEKINSSISLSNHCCAPSEPNITSTKEATPSIRRSLADANSFRPLPLLPSTSTLQLPSFLNFSTRSFAVPSGTRIQRSASSLPGSVLFRISSMPVSSHRRVVVRKIKTNKIYEGPNWIPAFHHPNSPYVPWTSSVRRRVLATSSHSTSPIPHHHLRSGAVAPEPWTTDTCSEMPKRSRKEKLASSWKSFTGSIKKGVQNIAARFRKSSNISFNGVTQDVDIPTKENATVANDSSSPTRARSACSRHSLKSFASSDSRTLACWLAERRTTACGIDESAGEMSIEEYELMGSWLDLRGGEGEWVCGVRDCGLHTRKGSPSCVRGRLEVFRTTMPFDSPDLLLTPSQPSPSVSSEIIASPPRFCSLPRLPSHAVDMTSSICKGGSVSGADAERRLVNQKSRELTMPGGWTLC